jgi:GTP 3',8-cyclase
MFDSYNRNINYLRISVTDKCNLRCVYCMPAEGVKSMDHKEILSLEEIFEFTKTAVKFGIDKVRITGGEPLVRKNIVHLVSMLSSLKEIKDLSMTTNAILLEQMAKPLADAGLQRINISLDTVDADKYSEITRGGDIKQVVRGIVAAQFAGLSPIKINCVIDNSPEEPDAIGVREFCKDVGVEVRFIHRMDLESGDFSIVEGGTGGNCRICNRLRLSANGLLRPCLFSDISYNIRELGYEEALKQAVSEKPECGTFSITNKFNSIGG